MGGSLASVAIDDLHVVGVTIGPSETDAPLVVDPDAVLAFAAALQGFEPVCPGVRRSSTTAALPSMRNLRRTTDWISCGKRRDRVPLQIFSASLSAKFLITGQP